MKEDEKENGLEELRQIERDNKRAKMIKSDPTYYKSVLYL